MVLYLAGDETVGMGDMSHVNVDKHVAVDVNMMMMVMTKVYDIGTLGMQELRGRPHPR